MSVHAQPANRLIYVLNKYSHSDASHFAHILHLLETMAGQGCIISLIVEKPEELPAVDHPSISVTGLATELPILRHIELFIRIALLILRGSTATFVRIAAPASIVASLAHRTFGGHSFLWQSGTTHEHDWEQPRSLKKMRWWVTSFLPNWIARRLVHWFVTGPESMVDYYATVVGVNRKKIRLLYNDVRIARFDEALDDSHRGEFLDLHQLPSNTIVLLLVHRLSPVRRTLMYLRPMLAALRLSGDRRWVLVVAGGGSELNGAKDLAQAAGVGARCIFLGEVPNTSIAKLYAVADIFVNPTYTEGFPRVVIEAMASGLPMVTTDAGGTSELIGVAQREYLVDRRNPEAFATALLRLISRPEAWRILAAENRNEVKRFSTDAVAEMYIRTIFP